MKHIAWDHGAIDDAINDLFGMTPKQSTTKTLCNKRVNTANIDNNDPTCQQCESIHWEEEQIAEEIRIDMRKRGFKI